MHQHIAAMLLDIPVHLLVVANIELLGGGIEDVRKPLPKLGTKQAAASGEYNL
jgi:hypothetical protein